MPNMSYCRFSNTVSDMHDCYEHMDISDPENEDMSEGEKRARISMLRLCSQILADYGYEIDEEED